MLDQPEMENEEQNNAVLKTIEQYQYMPRKKETKEAIEKLKNNKAPGQDMIGAELLKRKGLIVNDMLKLIKKIW